MARRAIPTAIQAAAAAVPAEQRDHFVARAEVALRQHPGLDAALVLRQVQQAYLSRPLSSQRYAGPKPRFPRSPMEALGVAHWRVWDRS